MAFLDNNKNVQGSEIDGIKIVSPQQGVKKMKADKYIIVVLGHEQEIAEQLLSLGVDKNIIKTLPQDNTWGELTLDYFTERLNEAYYLDKNCPFEIYAPVIKSKSQDDRDFRIYLDDGLIDSLEKEEDPLENVSMDDYEKVYGKYFSTNSLKLYPDGSTRLKVMIVCCHKDSPGFIQDNPKYYVPIQAGKALTDIKLYDLCDNTGDNISARNYNYCECTALYWAWKNGFSRDADYVGLRHYRRKFDISDEQLKNLKENDVAIVHIDPIYHDNIRHSFTKHTKHAADWDLMHETILTKFPDYAEAMEEYENQHFICAYNMTIMRTDVFDAYCHFLFGVLFEIESYYLAQYDRRDRYLGFLAENLTSIFIIKNRAKKQIIAKLLPNIKG